VDATGEFRSWRLEWGAGGEPTDWITLVGDIATPIPSAIVVYSWDLTGIPYGQVSLRLHLDAVGKGYAEKMIRLNLNLPTATPTPTDTPTPTNTPTLTPSETPTETIGLPATVPPLPADTPMP
jgi:hypothetical protein